DLLAVEEELPRPLGLVTELARRGVGADVRVPQPRLAALEARVGVLQVRPPGAQRLDLAARQHEAGLERLDDLVVVPRLAVDGDDGVAGNALLGFSLVRLHARRFRSSPAPSIGAAGSAFGSASGTTM